VRWLAPILSFTAEEIWQHFSKQNEADSSVLLLTWYDQLPVFNSAQKQDPSFWETMRLIRNQVNKEIEYQRSQALLGSALEANVTLYVEQDLKALLDQVGDELRFIFITSSATVETCDSRPADAKDAEIPGVFLKVVATKAQKCERCWHRTDDVGAELAYPGICLRCVSNISTEQGEVRYYA
jgi:isoleucyl-tRNA synthetase